MSTETDSSNPEDEIERNFGPQPMDAIMLEHGFTNHDVVGASKEPMTHKAVQRARKGRKLTIHMQTRMIVAMNTLLRAKNKEHKDLGHRQLFNYKA